MSSRTQTSRTQTGKTQAGRPQPTRKANRVQRAASESSEKSSESPVLPRKMKGCGCGGKVAVSKKIDYSGSYSDSD